MRRIEITLLLSVLAFNCLARDLTMDQAVKLARLPLRCISSEYPNKTSHLINNRDEAVLEPHDLHPSFFGCLDWHSSVHGHWMLLKILKEFPGIQLKDSIIMVLNNSFHPDKILAEADYWVKYKDSNTFERTYGWAWLLKLDEELYTWNDPAGEIWRKALQPLTLKIAELWKNYLAKLTYPNRTGVHPNTAFGLVFALDWARTVKDTSFESAIIAKANEFYLGNKEAPAYLEPDGSDFLSPSLEIADLMRRILPQKSFTKWLNKFYDSRSIENLTQMPVVSDRTDYQIVHLDGLALSRAWCMKGIAGKLPPHNKTRLVFENSSRYLLEQSLPNILSGNYGGEHWLASFAVYALSL